MTILRCLQAIADASRTKQDQPNRNHSNLKSLCEKGFCSMVLDIASAMVAGVIAYQLTLDVQFTGLSKPPALTSLLYLLLFALYVVVLCRMLGLYESSGRLSGRRQGTAVLQATMGAGLLLCGSLYLMHEHVISRIVIVTTVMITCGLVGGRRLLAQASQQRRHLRGLDTCNVLIVGNGRVAHALRNHLDAWPHKGFRFKGFIAVTKAAQRESDPETVGSLEDCLEIARSLFVDEIYFSVPLESAAVLPVVEEARSRGIQVSVVPHLYEGLAWNACVEHIGQFPIIPLYSRQINLSALAVKRVFDVLVASLILALTLPITLAVALLIWQDSEGPIFYRSRRIGLKGRVFHCYKFRTMVNNADELKAQIAHMNERSDVLFKVRKDPRVTKIGAKLRKYSLDEIPQLVNVLRGDMSLVGPRPSLACEVDQYSLSHLRRLNVLPGMTGLRWHAGTQQTPGTVS